MKRYAREVMTRGAIIDTLRLKSYEWEVSAYRQYGSSKASSVAMKWYFEERHGMPCKAHAMLLLTTPDSTELLCRELRMAQEQVWPERKRESGGNGKVLRQFPSYREQGLVARLEEAWTVLCDCNEVRLLSRCRVEQGRYLRMVASFETPTEIDQFVVAITNLRYRVWQHSGDTMPDNPADGRPRESLEGRGS